MEAAATQPGKSPKARCRPAEEDGAQGPAEGPAASPSDPEAYSPAAEDKTTEQLAPHAATEQPTAQAATPEIDGWQIM